uniref:L-type lectin-like domain-containing protein n=1 Tax=Spongospora subterranea TaxID=70186 RepID=A0A0H5QG77_9EUKA|eukprot:CRZ01058.1 hypothetical protein [Spongospora subterranea]
MSGSLALFLTCSMVLSGMTYADSPMDLRQPFQRGAWQAFGSTIFSPNQSILTTQLGTPGMVQKGSLWNQTPFPYKNQWEILLRTKVSGRGKDGEGIALWLTEEPNELGNIFGGKDYFKGLGIFFDSYDNDARRNNPSISAHYFDGTRAYNHSDDGLGSQLAGCIADYRNRMEPVATKIAYNSTHLSIHVDLLGNGEFRKCLIEPVQIRTDRDVYLGVSAETRPGQFQETQDILSIEVKGLTDWSRPSPPSVNPAWKTEQQQAAQKQQQQYQQAGQAWSPPQGYVPPTPPQAQQQYVPPTPPQSQQQFVPPVPPQAQQDRAPVPPASTWTEASEAATLHDKIDRLMATSTNTALESAQAGEALKEVQTNVIQKVHHATTSILGQLRKTDMSLSAHVSAMSTQVNSLTRMIEANKGGLDAGRVDAERRANQLEAQLVKLQGDLKEANDAVERLSRSFQASISREIGKGTARMAAASKSNSHWNGWMYFVMFQGVFVVFLAYRQFTNKKLDKLL